MSTIDIEELMTSREVAEILGMSTHTVLDMAQDGRLPSFKLGGKVVRFRKSEIATWIETQRRVAP
jgi:excisionase family DNA binding protein